MKPYGSEYNSNDWDFKWSKKKGTIVYDIVKASHKCARRQNKETIEEALNEIQENYDLDESEKFDESEHPWED